MITYHVHIKRMASGDHEVHVEGCVWCPPKKQLCPLGKFESPDKAMKSAKKIYPNANGCHLCMSKHYHLP